MDITLKMKDARREEEIDKEDMKKTAEIKPIEENLFGDDKDLKDERKKTPEIAKKT